MQYKTNNISSKKGSLTVTGYSCIKVVSDLVQLNVTIINTSKILEDAQNEINKISKNILASLLSYGISKDNIQNSNISITSNHNPNDNTIISYTATQIINIILCNINTVKDIYSLVLENGANGDITIDYRLSNPYYFYNKALKKTSQDALNKASILAKSLSLTYDTIPSKVNELSSLYSSITYSSSTKFISSPEIEFGLVKVCANIETTFMTYTC